MTGKVDVKEEIADVVRRIVRRHLVRLSREDIEIYGRGIPGSEEYVAKVKRDSPTYRRLRRIQRYLGSVNENYDLE